MSDWPWPVKVALAVYVFSAVLGPIIGAMIATPDDDEVEHD